MESGDADDLKNESGDPGDLKYRYWRLQIPRDPGNLKNRGWRPRRHRKSSPATAETLNIEPGDPRDPKIESGDPGHFNSTSNQPQANPKPTPKRFVLHGQAWIYGHELPQKLEFEHAGNQNTAKQHPRRPMATRRKKRVAPQEGQPSSQKRTRTTPRQKARAGRDTRKTRHRHTFEERAQGKRKHVVHK